MFRGIKEDVNTALGSFGFGALVLFVVHTTTGYPILDASSANGGLIRVWPDPHTFAWPPADSFSDAELEEISGDLGLFFDE